MNHNEEITIRKATKNDIERIVEIYDTVHTKEEAGLLSIGWKRGIYPTEQTVVEAIKRDDMFVEIHKNIIVAVAIINQTQVKEYYDCEWEHTAEDCEVMVLHTLSVDPEMTGHGYAKKMVAFYEEYAKEHSCKYLRMDTQIINTAARKLYAGLGYREAGIVESTFNGIPNVKLVLLEKKISV